MNSSNLVRDMLNEMADPDHIKDVVCQRPRYAEEIGRRHSIEGELIHIDPIWFKDRIRQVIQVLGVWDVLTVKWEREASAAEIEFQHVAIPGTSFILSIVRRSSNARASQVCGLTVFCPRNANSFQRPFSSSRFAFSTASSSS